MTTLPGGMYRQGNSVIHLMNPVYKIICFFIIAAAVICTGSIPGYLLFAAFTALAVFLSGIEISQLAGPIYRMRWFFLIILLMNCCFFARSEAWFSIWILSPSASGLMQGINVSARVILILIYSNILCGTTAPMAMTDGLQRLIQPFSLIGLPTALIAMIISVAIQFIPVLFEETDMIKKAQTARGAGFESNKFSQRAKAVFSLALPVFLSAFKRADELSIAMEARGYKCEKRGRRKIPLKAGRTDFSALIICAAVLLAQIFIF